MRTFVLLVAALALAGCTGGEPTGMTPTPPATSTPSVTSPTAPTSSSPPPTATPTATPEPIVTPTAGTVSPLAIVIENFQFTPADASIPNGTIVVWRNADTSGHTATHPTEFNSGLIAAGDEFRHTFTTAGVFAYQCAFHPEMTGTVTVSQ